ncbi:hypothetical protein NECAME_14245 [Necator americanus]|uniref:Uncharacterized protein n=1 Tax=Necator americanus TaxID=51031 RepID=W2SPB8_NECAM|nr:hypothetical protein NECAME_14245 [Necator americanus]ETN71353.1 hypothetical protein NECAME_14245 [Necator americanus]
MGLAPTETHTLNTVSYSRQRQSKMQPQHTLLITVLAIFVLAAFIPSTVEAQEYGPILMNRRDLLPYGEIVSELKGKTMGGRMRFGKRSGNALHFVPAVVLDAYEHQQQQQQL